MQKTFRFLNMTKISKRVITKFLYYSSVDSQDVYIKDGF
jgi:hypothetical protein